MTDPWGLLGVVFLAGCWIPQIAHLVRSRRAEGVSLGFALMILAANIFLTIHALRIRSAVFAGVNAFAGVMAAIQLLLVLRHRRAGS